MLGVVKTGGSVRKQYEHGSRGAEFWSEKWQIEERRSGGRKEEVGEKSSSRMKFRGGLANEGFKCIANVGGLAK